MQRRKRLQRRDISSEMVVALVTVYGFRAYEVLCETFPYKVVQAAYLRDVGKGLISYGTSLHRPWVEPDGERLIRSEKYKVIC